ncbi:MAG: hypothetical protein WAM28_01115, partial [Chlamydiales bacterium]
ENDAQEQRKSVGRVALVAIGLVATVALLIAAIATGGVALVGAGVLAFVLTSAYVYSRSDEQKEGMRDIINTAKASIGTALTEAGSAMKKKYKAASKMINRGINQAGNAINAVRDAAGRGVTAIDNWAGRQVDNYRMRQLDKKAKKAAEQRKIERQEKAMQKFLKEAVAKRAERQRYLELGQQYMKQEAEENFE